MTIALLNDLQDQGLSDRGTVDAEHSLRAFPADLVPARAE